MMRTNFCKMICLGCALFAAAVVNSPAQTFATLANLTASEGSAPFSSLVQGRDGSLYGTAFNGGAYGWGSIFRVTPNGTLTTLHSFCAQANCGDGANPVMIILATDGNFYGTTYYGGSTCSSSGIGLGCGTVFKMTPSGLLTVLHSFNGTDGNVPTWVLEGSDKNLYGTTFAGGSGSLCSSGCGIIFRMTPAGKITTLHNFNQSDGIAPTGLLQGADGHLYGTTYAGGKYDPEFCIPYGGCGTIFKATTGGGFASLHSFDLTDGAIPYAPVAQASDGTFYGTTFYGSGNNSGDDGTIFSITSRGRFETAYQFTGIHTNPIVGLFPASDGALYGTMEQGATCGTGQIYSIGQTDVFTTVYDGGCQIGGYNDAIVQTTSGKLYGTYSNAVFSLDLGLGPFVAFVIPTGKVGQTAQILGQRLTGATSVTFNGIPATSFRVVSDTYVTAVVPSGATTGPVVVTTPSGTLTSNVSFRIAK